MKYRSKFEARLAKELTDAGIPFEYEKYSYEYTEPLRKNRTSCKACGSTDLQRTGWYTPDFFLKTKSVQHGPIIEAKGRFTAADRRKMLAVREHKELKDIKLLFMKDQPIHRNSKTHYSDWAMENDFDFSVGTFKKEWLK